ncbi:cytochrome c-type biogenesis protein [Phenylobacterium sp.]|uniref:cytochrome c-type biogenesis protein n=1 Tax=Phenylobacterium sp. TaxID=1871053 RepID=UPI00286B8ECE|nr:cytochrome c-type biogenesis protein [Phenylobacterium sp.]
MRRGLAILAAVFCLAAASDPAERLADPAQEARARAMFREVRCLVCQNESIDDSSAELAADLRRLVRDQVASGKSDDQVRDHLTERYGEYVLLKPAFSWGNAALWGAPFLVVGLGLALLVGGFRNRAAEGELSQDEAARLARLSHEEGAGDAP